MRARLLQFVTGSSRVPLQGFKALQGEKLTIMAIMKKKKTRSLLRWKILQKKFSACFNSSFSQGSEDITPFY